MKPYEKISKYYKKYWGKDSIRYVELFSNVINTFKVRANSVLDVGCGTGILAREFQNMNFEVSGIDISEDMIDVAKETTTGINFEVADMKDFNLNRKFDIITCAFDAINYITNDIDMENTLKNIYLHLKDDGVFIFDINTPTLYEERHFGTIDRNFEDIQFKQILAYDKLNRIGKTVFDFGNNEVETHIQRAYSVEEMDRLLLNVGFEVIGRYKSFKLSAIDDRTYKVFYVVKKK